MLGAFELAISRGVIASSDVTEEILVGFLGGHGRRFYGVGDTDERIRLRKDGCVIEESVKGEGVEVVPFRRGQTTWGVEWV